MSDAPTIRISGSYHLGERCVFAPLDLELPSGQWSCVLGRSGVGKSSLLRLVAGLECAGRFEGNIRASDGAGLEGRISFMAQSDLLLPWASVLENTVLGARLRGTAPEMERAKDLLGRIGLARYCHKKPAALSGGMRQRVALARTLMEDRPVALLDEPFSALDAGTRADMQELAATMLAGKTVVMVTHDPAEAVRLGHRIIVLAQDGARFWTPPDTPPVRDQYVPETALCQAGLLELLRGLERGGA